MKVPQQKITGILLAGGQSSRMGQDKGMIRLGKFLMYQYPLRILESLCDEILISTCKPMNIKEDYEQVCDKIPGIGPIGGTVTCLEKSSNDLNIILSYDLPLINRELFVELLKYSKETTAIANVLIRDDETQGSKTTRAGELPERNRAIKPHAFDIILPAASPDRPEPLCGIYRKSTIPFLYQMIDQGIFAMHKLIPQVRAKIIPVGKTDPFYHARLFKNINTESDLSGLPEQLL
jgi:molybdopterin-guanine dinucleotide biosynthesis protein A